MNSVTSAKILYIEDDSGLAALAQRRLGRAGFQVDTAPDGERGLEKCRAETYDVMLVDYKLPGMNGLDLVASLTAENRLPPTIMVSGAGDLKVAVEAMRLGVGDYLVKEVGSGYLELLEPTILRVMRTARLQRDKEEAEARLKDVARQQAAILENIPDLAWLKDKESRFIAVNEPFGEKFGVPPGQMIGKTHLDIWPAELAESYREDDREVMRSRERKRVEEPLIEASGEMRWVETVKTPVFNDAGDVVGTTGIARDITDRKQAEERLFAEKERLLVTLQSIGDAVISTDAQGDVEYLNPVAEYLTGWKLEEARGLPLRQIFVIVNEETREPAPDPVARCFAEGRVIGLANHTILISRSGTEYAIQDSAAPIRSRDERILGVVLVFHDVTEARSLAAQMTHQALHDGLTGLVNRREFERRLQRSVDNAIAHGGEHALCYLDLDQFKVVNDTAGHVAGDEMLKQIAHILGNKVRSRDTLARVGGDEFTLILENCALDKAIEICDSLISALQEYSFRWGERTFRVGVSIGVVLITLATSDATQAMTQADVACYTAKDLGRNRIYVYSSDDGKPTMRHAEIHRAAELREALDRGDFHLFQQAIYPVAASPRVAVEYEILIRMKDRMGKMIPPGAFIPAAERFSLMEGIDRWVIETAFRWFSETRHENPLTGIAINLSGASLGNNTLLDFIRHQMEAFSIPGARLCFEITETAAINNLTDAVHLITELKQQGCRFALDDFGSGLSSFNYIKTIPVDYLKIDGSLVRDIAEDPVDRAMVTAINQVGKAMGVQTIAEWVETEAVVAVLTDIGVDYMQGYLLGEPKPIR